MHCSIIPQSRDGHLCLPPGSRRHGGMGVPEFFVSQRVVQRIRIPVEGLRVAQVADYRIRTDKPANIGVIVPGPVVVEVNAGEER